MLHIYHFSFPYILPLPLRFLFVTEMGSTQVNLRRWVTREGHAWKAHNPFGLYPFSCSHTTPTLYLGGRGRDERLEMWNFHASVFSVDTTHNMSSCVGFCILSNSKI
jgi:hypothetical protein